MTRAHNFNAGPAVLPLEVLEEAQAEFLDFQGTGISLIESSHRSPEYDGVNAEATALLLELLGLGDDYQAMFLQGGASQQFAMVPMNLLHPGRTADYITTGGWAEKALKEARLLGEVNEAANTKSGASFPRIPRPEELKLTAGAAYVHLTTNNTLMGTQWQELPDTGDVPIVADMSSDCLWKPHDLRRVGLIYAGAQKNLGPAGATAVVIRKDLLAGCREDLPVIFRYGTHAAKDGLYNTPSCFAVYMIGKVLRWVKDQGGAAAMEKLNREKGGLIYGVMEKYPEFFRSPVEKESRSYMNLVWRLPSEELEKRFVAEAKEQGMVGPQGPPQRRRLPGEPLQFLSPRLGPGPGGLHGGVRPEERVGAVPGGWRTERLPGAAPPGGGSDPPLPATGPLRKRWTGRRRRREYPSCRWRSPARRSNRGSPRGSGRRYWPA